MVKKSLNESRKSTIQKVVALTAHSKSSENSSSSSEHKSSNGSTRSAAANKNSVNSNEKLVKILVQKQTEKKKNADVKKNHLLPPSVQKAPRQVPNSHHAKSHQKVPPSLHSKPPHMKRRFQQMDTCQGNFETLFFFIFMNCLSYLPLVFLG
ncbi:hypothetical protein Taro_039426 [Colocasia esculenta]|uniref:Uncharacterized protein n=1 Tax=Colocasia esculenta TaxID=4460 RepID=A0A843WAM7_COLES|nr:hypothetical protein [Colocasia esculenta]